MVNEATLTDRTKPWTLTLFVLQPEANLQSATYVTGLRVRRSNLGSSNP